jgi:hypothetical protein
MKKYLPLNVCLLKTVTSRADMFIYMRGLHGIGNLQHSSILKDYKPEIEKFPNHRVFALYTCLCQTTYPQSYVM